MEENPRDFFGNQIVLGQEVAFMQLGYRHLLKGEVIHISPKHVQIRHKKTNVGRTETKQQHCQIIVNYKL